MTTMYDLSDDGVWYKTVFAEQCDKKVLFHKCQGIKGHEGNHWRYKPNGNLELGYNPIKNNISYALIPPGNDGYIDPTILNKDYYMHHSTTEIVTDPVVIEKLNKGKKPEKNCCVTRPVMMSELDPETRKKLEKRLTANPPDQEQQ